MLNLKCMKYRINFCDVHPILFIFDLTLASIFYDLTNHLVNTVYIFFFSSQTLSRYIKYYSGWARSETWIVNSLEMSLHYSLQCSSCVLKVPFSKLFPKLHCAWRRRGDNLTFQNNHMHMHDFEIR
jgi:hypothetical protein